MLAQAVQQTTVWRGFRVWQRNRDAFLRSWKVEVGGIAIEPFIMLVALGLGLGAYIQQIDGRSYAQFLAPGVIASYAMFHATFDSTFGAYLRMESHHVYEAILFTPLDPEDIVLGEVMWGATRSLMSGTAVLLGATAFGLVGSPMAIFAIPVAYLIGLTFASIAMIMTATATTIGAMNNFFTLLIIPMFWVSGVFFPLENLPEIVQTLSWVLPLTPAAALVRGLVTGDLSPWMLAWALELLAFLGVALWLAGWFMRRRLIK
jgi:lipooligosaccharide transport system permease protein